MPASIYRDPAYPKRALRIFGECIPKPRRALTGTCQSLQLACPSQSSCPIPPFSITSSSAALRCRPESPNAAPTSRPPRALYFTIITLGTIGYGDVLPTNGGASDPPESSQRGAVCWALHDELRRRASIQAVLSSPVPKRIYPTFSCCWS
jgi:hypothetical protein